MIQKKIKIPFEYKMKVVAYVEEHTNYFVTTHQRQGN